MIVRHVPISEAERLFLDVGVSVYTDYLNRLESAGQEDFDGLVWRAAALMANGQSRFARSKGRERGDIRSLRFVLVDEFQDYSGMFHALSQGIRSLSPGAQFFCVGDDWQAINGFAGSDLRFFSGFAEHFRATTTLNVSTNYRSPVQVVHLGNALMAGRGDPAVPHRPDPGWVTAAYLADFSPSVPEQDRHPGDEATPAVLRLVRHLLDSCRGVVMLSRRNDVPWYVSYGPGRAGELDGLERYAEHVRSFLPDHDRERVTASTAHRYKGLEKEAVIILDADEGSYPLIHPNWVFLRVFGDSVEGIEAEERRLFYVAATRSQHSLVILSDERERESPYLGEIRSRVTVPQVEWQDYPPVLSLDSARLEVRVLNAYGVRDQLKNLGYRWDGPGKYWCRSMVAEGFDFDVLCQQPWAQAGVHIEVYSELGGLLKRR
jgi:DNA helicase-4